MGAGEPWLLWTALCANALCSASELSAAEVKALPAIAPARLMNLRRDNRSAREVLADPFCEYAHDLEREMRIGRDQCDEATR